MKHIWLVTQLFPADSPVRALPTKKSAKQWIGENSSGLLFSEGDGDGHFIARTRGPTPLPATASKESRSEVRRRSDTTMRKMQ